MRHAVTSSTLPAEPPSNETLDVFYIKMYLPLEQILPCILHNNAAQEDEKQLKTVTPLYNFQFLFVSVFFNIVWPFYSQSVTQIFSLFLPQYFIINSVRREKEINWHLSTVFFWGGGWRSKCIIETRVFWNLRNSRSLNTVCKAFTKLTSSSVYAPLRPCGT